MAQVFVHDDAMTHWQIRRFGIVCIGCCSLAVVVSALLMPWGMALPFCLAFLLVLAFVIRPDWGAYALIFFVPLTTASLYFYPAREWNFVIAKKGIDLIPVFTPFVVGTFIGTFAQRFAGAQRKVAGDFLLLPLGILLAYAVSTILWSGSPYHSAFQVALFALNGAVFWLITTHVQTERDLVGAVRCFILSMLLQAAVYAICFFLEPYSAVHEITQGFFFVMQITGGFFQASGMPMVDGGFLDHHELAMLSNLALAVTFGHFLCHVGRFVPCGSFSHSFCRIMSGENQVYRSLQPGKNWLIFAMAVFVVVTLHTESRAGIGAMMILLFSAFLFFRFSRPYFLRISLLVVLLLPAVYFLHAQVVGRISGEMESPRLFVLGSKMVKNKEVIDPGIEKKDEGRSELWKNSFHRLSGSVIQGLGAGNLKRVSEAPHAHSIFLSFLFDYGILGVLTIVTIVLFLLRRFWLLVQHQRTYCQIVAVAFGTGLTAIAFHGQFDFEYNTTSLWLYLALTVASFRLSFQEITQGPGKWRFRKA